MILSGDERKKELYEKASCNDNGLDEDEDDEDDTAKQKVAQLAEPEARNCTRTIGVGGLIDPFTVNNHRLMNRYKFTAAPGRMLIRIAE